jgi:hypothetical protein
MPCSTNWFNNFLYSLYHGILGYASIKRKEGFFPYKNVVIN